MHAIERVDIEPKVSPAVIGQEAHTVIIEEERPYAEDNLLAHFRFRREDAVKQVSDVWPIA